MRPVNRIQSASSSIIEISVSTDHAIHGGKIRSIALRSESTINLDEHYIRHGLFCRYAATNENTLFLFSSLLTAISFKSPHYPICSYLCGQVYYYVIVSWFLQWTRGSTSFSEKEWIWPMQFTKWPWNKNQRLYGRLCIICHFVCMLEFCEKFHKIGGEAQPWCTKRTNHSWEHELTVYHNDYTYTKTNTRVIGWSHNAHARFRDHKLGANALSTPRDNLPHTHTHTYNTKRTTQT